jgi:hypothetical protein
MIVHSHVPNMIFALNQCNIRNKNILSGKTNTPFPSWNTVRTGWVLCMVHEMREIQEGRRSTESTGKPDQLVRTSSIRIQTNLSIILRRLMYILSCLDKNSNSRVWSNKLRIIHDWWSVPPRC